MQQEVFKWSRDHSTRKRYPELALLHAVPNAVVGGVGLRVKMVREGLESGMPDIHLPVPKCGFSSLWVELKRPAVKDGKKTIYPAGRLSENQRDKISMLRKHGNLVLVLDSIPLIITSIIAYCENKRDLLFSLNGINDATEEIYLDISGDGHISDPSLVRN